ncbi:endonuclease/exonuclease/phosphatase family protein [Sphingobacterium sp. BIGb0165]|uniref:endonuclease/exonuclease/phosphatase family protein n=1 Tax=Sphingobacterium sp. BIGb0165 TaxID=2940615 RepID=UPI002168621F|nr:endonuclease/exonuclease/phosphatase family protein [Sphingobacterium sp. BIGb0165]MCS4223985.1 endonuclease/exonuclease/phosphatase family metal-dependent hydrolase [Sphingobacterium sp. BIGb0165]
MNMVYVDMPDVSEGKLNLLTYNIAGLPELISSAVTERAPSITSIGELVNPFDIVNVQEDFNYNKFLYSKNRHSYRTENMGGIPFGDGLSTLSKYPIQDFERVSWDACNGADCLTPKGFSYARIQLAKEVFIDVYNVHATAQDDPDAAIARQKNLNQLKNYIQKNSAGQPLLIMGDFNAHYAYALDNIVSFQGELGLVDAWVNLKNSGKIPQSKQNFVAMAALELTDDCEGIDKIYYRNNDQMVFEAKNYQVQKKLFQNRAGQDLSDHCAVSLQLGWHLIKPSVQ